MLVDCSNQSKQFDAFLKIEIFFFLQQNKIKKTLSNGCSSMNFENVRLASNFGICKYSWDCKYGVFIFFVTLGQMQVWQVWQKFTFA
jgi:hypothetical protein